MLNKCFVVTSLITIWQNLLLSIFDQYCVIENNVDYFKLRLNNLNTVYFIDFIDLIPSKY